MNSSIKLLYRDFLYAGSVVCVPESWRTSMNAKVKSVYYQWFNTGSASWD